jgi:hypothetical protein
MKTRWKILIAIGIFLTVFVGIGLVTVRIQPQSEVEAYKKLLREKGERLEISEVLPPPVVPESNGVALMQSAFALFSPADDDWTNLPYMMRMVVPGKAMVGWAQPEVRGDDFTNSWESVIAAAAASRPATEFLQQAANYPAIDFQPDYYKGFEIRLEHLALLKRSAQRLSAAAMCNLHNCDAASATTNLCALLGIVQGEHDERILISQLVRIAMASIAVSASWEFLQSTNLTDAELAELQNRWEQSEFASGFEGAMLLDRASVVTTIRKLRTSKTEFAHLMGFYGGGSATFPASSGDWLEDAQNFAKAGMEKAVLGGEGFMWHASWSYSDELRALKAHQVLLEAFREAETNQALHSVCTNVAAQFAAMGISPLGEGLIRLDMPDLRELFSESISDFGSVMRKVMVANTSKRVVITAIALKRYQLKRGNYPPNLDSLVPEFLSTVPLDPVDGKPLRYHPNADGTFLLFSVGENGVDDGGNPSLEKGATGSHNWQNPHALDWVWPQPATPEEVRYFYEHPPK